MGAIITREKSSGFQHADLESLPSDVIMEIYSRVPTLDLVKLRYVFKRWREIMDDPLFRSIHCSNSLSKPNENQVLILKQGSELYFMDLTDKTNHLEAIKIATPYVSDTFYYYFIGSCNGLLCLGSEYYRSILVMNPFTRQYKVFPLPPPSDMACSRRVSSWGFGFDSVTRSFKVVVMMWDRFVQYSEVRVCDLKSDESSNWRYIGKKSILFSNKNPACFVNGRLHWTHLGSPSIISFDLADEEFRLVPTPDCLHDSRNVNLIVVRGCLCIFPSQYCETLKFHIWVMRKYGVKESWMKEVNITPFVPRSVTSHLKKDRSDSRWHLNGLELLRDGEVLLKYNTSPFEEAVFLSSNTTHDGFMPLELERRRNPNGSIVHVASLNWI